MVRFVPQGFLHCVINVLPTSAIAVEVGPDAATPGERASVAQM